MPDELNMKGSLTFIKGNESIVKALKDFYLTIAGSGAQSPTVLVGTSEEDYSFGDVGTPGLLWLRNLDAANYVQWGPKDAGVMVLTGRLLPTALVAKPAPPTILYLDSGSVTLRWKAHTAACLVETILIPA